MDRKSRRSGWLRKIDAAYANHDFLTQVQIGLKIDTCGDRKLVDASHPHHTTCKIAPHVLTHLGILAIFDAPSMTCYILMQWLMAHGFSDVITR